MRFRNDIDDMWIPEDENEDENQGDIERENRIQYLEYLERKHDEKAVNNEVKHHQEPNIEFLILLAAAIGIGGLALFWIGKFFAENWQAIGFILFIIVTPYFLYVLHKRGAF